MSQVTTPQVPSGSGLSVREAINAVMAALMSSNSGSSEPPNPMAGMVWFDTTANDLKIRNTANTAWLLLSDMIGALEYDRPQTLAATARLQAATNIGALVYDQEQSLTDPQKTQARGNIGAGIPTFLGITGSHAMLPGVAFTNPSPILPLNVEIFSTNTAGAHFVELFIRQSTSHPWVMIGRGWNEAHARATGIIPAGWQYKFEGTSGVIGTWMY